MQRRHQGPTSCTPSTRQGCETVADVKKCTRAGTHLRLLRADVSRTSSRSTSRASARSSTRACASTSALTRQELFDVVAVHGYRRFDDIVEPTARAAAATSASPRSRASWPASSTATSSSRRPAELQDTNDAYLANIQRNGTYSVVPRIPGGEITPDKLIVIGEVARDFGLYTKITGGQRIDLFGARMEQLPAIWRRLVDAGLRVRPRLRQVAAHGEVVRRVDLVPLRRAGLRRVSRSRSSSATAACAAPTSSRAASAAAPASAPRRAARTSA